MKTMKAYDILTSTYCTILSSGIGYARQGQASLYDILTRKSDVYKQRVEALRNLGYGSEAYKERKKYFPCFMPTGVFKDHDVHDSAIITYSNVISIDIDKSDNPDVNFDILKTEIFKLPYVLSVSESISGQGLFALVYVENGEFTKSYCQKIEYIWNNKFNIKVDGQCKNLARKRFLSYDENILVKNNEEISPWTLKMQKPIQIDPIFELPTIKRPYSNEFDYENLLPIVIHKLINAGFSVSDYNSWIRQIFYLKAFANGYDMFLEISKNSSNFKSEDDVAKQWNKINNANSKDEGYKYYFGTAKRILGPNYLKDIIAEKKQQLKKSV